MRHAPCNHETTMRAVPCLPYHEGRALPLPYPTLPLPPYPTTTLPLPYPTAHYRTPPYPLPYPTLPSDRTTTTTLPLPCPTMRAVPYYEGRALPL